MSPKGHRIMRRLLAVGDVHLPHLAVVETASVLRRALLQHRVTSARAVMALDDLERFDAVRHPHDPYLRRVWQLRDNVSAYDAVYVALAEALDAPLITCDARLARAPLPGVEIELVG